MNLSQFIVDPTPGGSNDYEVTVPASWLSKTLRDYRKAVDAVESLTNELKLDKFLLERRDREIESLRATLPIRLDVTA